MLFDELLIQPGVENKNHSLILSKVDDWKINQKYRVLIFCAGKGSRLKSDIPKALSVLHYKNGKRSILSNTLKNLSCAQLRDVISEIVLLVPENKDFYFDDYKKGNVTLLAIPPEAVSGTYATARWAVGRLGNAENTIIMWGDLAVWSHTTLEVSMKVKEKYCLDFVMPTRVKEDPYVAFLRDSETKNLSCVFHANEGQQYKGIAEQDASIFVLSDEALSLCFNDLSRIEFPAASGERDFVHTIPFICKFLPHSLLPIVDADQHFGVNTVEDLQMAEKKLESNCGV